MPLTGRVGAVSGLSAFGIQIWLSDAPGHMFFCFITLEQIDEVLSVLPASSVRRLSEA